MTTPTPMLTGDMRTAPLPVAPQPEPTPPEWWAMRLYKMLQERRDEVEVFDDYYRGEHPLPWLPHQVREEFQRVLRLSRSNYMGLVVDATAERLEVLGFRVSSPDDAEDDAQAAEEASLGDREAWRIWQANSLDAWSQQAFLEALKSGSAYMLVSPGATADTPLVTVEHPSQCIVEYESGSAWKRAAALKVWFDDIADQTNATLYLPGGIYKFCSRQKQITRWERRQGSGEPWPLPNPLGVVSMVELPNNPQLLRGGVSELADLTDVQDRINKTLADRMMTQDFGAFPQKWAVGWDLDDSEFVVDEQGNPVIDEETGQQATAPRPLDIGRSRLLRFPTGVELGQFAATPLDPYSGAKAQDVKDIAARSRTPSQYLLGEIVNVSAEALMAAESGLVSKTQQRQRPFGEALEEVIRLALRLAGDPRGDDMQIETVWRDPQYRSIAQLTDAVIKQVQVGLIPHEVGLEMLGKSPVEIRRIKRLMSDQQSTDPALHLAAALDAAASPNPVAAVSAATVTPNSA